MAWQGEQVDNCGAYNNQTQFMNWRANVHSAGPYEIDNIKTDTYGAVSYTHLEGYGKEVLLIHGELDEKVPVYAVGPYLDLYGQKARLEIIKGANHQFTSVEWKNKVYELSIEYIKEKTGSIEK